MARTSDRLASGGRTNLPSELTPFLGRERELSDLSRLIHGARLVSLLGPAGIGKTRLAVRLADLLSRRYPDGAWLIQLAPVADSDLLPAVIAGALGIAEARPGETLAGLEAALSSRQMLLVLDNCEHLVEPAAAVVEHLLRTCSGLTVLVTSRERLGVAGEAAWRVPPLDLPRTDRTYTLDELGSVEAVALFADRARRANAHFSLTEANRGDVADLVCRLDGLPLAVELAAGWMEALSPGELARELDQRYQILVARGPLVSERHSSLWAAIDASFARLDPVARDLFWQLGVFAGGWNLGGMTAVCRLESAPAVEVLGRLVDHSFVTVVPTAEGPTRYRLLNVLRRYALDGLEGSGRREATDRRFADHVVTVAETAAATLSHREGPRWLAVLDAELDNARAVFALDAGWAGEVKLRLAVALVVYWHVRGLLDEGQRHLRDVLRSVGPASPATVAALNGLSRLAWAMGDLRGAARRARAAFRTAGAIGDRSGEAFALMLLAKARFDAGRTAPAFAAVHRSAQIAREVGDMTVMGDCLVLVGQLALVEGRIDEAERLLRESVGVFSRAGDVHREALSLLALGRLHLQQARLDEAEAAMLMSLRQLREFALARPAVPMLESLAAVAADRGDHLRAARLAGAADGLLERMGARPPHAAPMRSALSTRWQASLGAPGGDVAFAEGRQMELRQAFAFALRESRPAAPPRRLDGAGPVLTRRQLEVARLVAKAQSNREIASRLGLSERTVEGHVEQICNRLGFNSRVQIGVWMTQVGEGK
ncbi:MAG TPA: LuxR C-terminal-related transcriptional regulator [Terriglobales bacterium]|nr:LuxR C-terminal-related transcriptional regulator [Terriglobales bacterium]